MTAIDTTAHRYQELSSIPVAQDLATLYDRIKGKHWLLRTYCGGLEKIGAFVLRHVYPFTKIANTVDSRVGKLKQEYPVVNMSPPKMWKQTKNFVSDKVQLAAHPVLSSSFGEYILHFFSWVLFLAEILYSFLTWSENPHRACPESNVMKREEVIHSTPIKPRPKQRDQSGTTSSGESNPNTAILNSKGTSRQLDRTSTMKKSGERDIEKMALVSRVPFLSRIYGIFVLTPLDLFIKGLRAIHYFITFVSHGRHGGPLSENSPVKVHQLRNRRKLSPRKRIHTTILGRIANNTCRILGLKPPSPLRQKDIRSYFSSSKQNQELNKSPNRGETENKRKHDEIQSDYDSDDENLLTMNLEDYRSDDDPDYEPSSHETSEETIEADEEAEESDVEVENLPKGLLRIKEKELKETIPATLPSGPKLTKAVSFDDWQDIQEDVNTSKSQSEPRTPLGEIISHSNLVSPLSKSKDKKPKDKLKPDKEKPKSPASRMPERRHSDKSEKSKPDIIKEQAKTDKPKTPEAPPTAANQKNNSTEGSSSRPLDACILNSHGAASKKEKTPTKKV